MLFVASFVEVRYEVDKCQKLLVVVSSCTYLCLYTIYLVAKMEFLVGLIRILRIIGPVRKRCAMCTTETCMQTNKYKVEKCELIRFRVCSSHSNNIARCYYHECAVVVAGGAITSVGLSSLALLNTLLGLSPLYPSERGRHCITSGMRLH